MTMMTKIGKLIKSIVFIAGFCVIMTLFAHVLRAPIGQTWAAQTGLEEVHKHKDKYDLCELGTSIVIANISNQELFEKYGITGISVGEPEQPLFLSAATLKDVLKVQEPKVVLLDTRALFYDDELTVQKLSGEEDYILHNSIDPIRSWKVKWEAVLAAGRFFETIDPKAYLACLYYDHANWKRLEKLFWTGYSLDNCMNGNLNLTGNGGEITAITENEWISQNRIDELRQIRDICVDHGVPLLLFTGYREGSEPKRHGLKALADREGIDYLDCNDYMQEIWFDEATDMSDHVHFNVLGTVKWTDFLGDYLKEHYDLPDHRGETVFGWYEAQSDVFHRKLEEAQANLKEQAS